MTIQIKLVLAGAAVLVVAVIAASMVSNARVRSLERIVDAAKQQARASEEAATAAEIRAAEYMQKIEHLEGEIAAIATVARRQDEELEKIGGDVGAARGDVERARRVRSVVANFGELCGKLEALGHPC